MDAMQPLQALIPDRPLLGVWVLVSCLAGGAATQNLAVVPHTIDQVDFRFSPGQRLPEVKMGAQDRHAALVSPPAFRQFRRIDAAAPSGDTELTATAPGTEVRLREPIGGFPPRPDALQAEFAAVQPSAALPLSVAAVPQVQPPVDAAVETAPALAESRMPIAFDAAFAGLGAPIAEEPTPAAVAAPESRAPALANLPELRGFDLARVMPSAARKPAGLIAPRDSARPSAAAAKPSTAGKRDRLLDATVYHPTTIMIGGQSAGQVDVRIGADMKPSIKVGDLLGMVSAQMDPELAAHLSAASGAADYVSFATLRDAGFKVSYNAGADSVSIGVAD